MPRTKVTAVIAVCSLAFAGSASATTMNLEPVAGISNIFDGVYRTGGITSLSNPNISYSNVGAGGFRVHDTISDENFIAWCLDIATTLDLSPPKTYNTTPTPFSQTSGTLSALATTYIPKLFDARYNETTLINDADESAAFQLALWELVFELPGTAIASLSVKNGQGNFYSTFSDAVTDLADAWLGALDDDVEKKYDVVYLEAPTNWKGQQKSQNLVRVTPVPPSNIPPIPLPAAFPLFAAGLGLLGLMGWRRRRQSPASV